MDIKGRRFLVIGGAGFIGSHTVDQLLEAGAAHVRIYDNFSRGKQENLAQALKDDRVEIYPVGGDMLHRDILRSAMDGMDGVFQFAALWLLHCQEYPRSAFEVNVGGTFNVLEAISQTPSVKRFVFSSSASVYGDAVEEPMTEDHPYNNTNFYGATKIAGEHMCRSMYHLYKDTPGAFDYVGLRYMNVYGPRQDYHGAYVSVIMKILDRLELGQPPMVYGDGSQSYDFVYVKDCAKANIKAMEATTTDAFYNVGTGIKTSIKELTEQLLKAAGSDAAIVYEPGGTTFVKNRVGCPKKALQELGFDASTRLPEGLKALIEWRHQHQQLQAGGGKVLAAV
ncbi:MAG: NAD-dependent epimerase/dehydratase family protein [Cyanobacteria bacterium HKST-UBA04]|nr:NAD-dependent epimerase/dehydratase family protein [Cyanobacteria bacterium HKST-UBA05]MCA9800073.1 NAD-dependent epimerase/dehydratase family protein [Cyanobacteria bacterium HKST-UBA04]